MKGTENPLQKIFGVSSDMDPDDLKKPASLKLEKCLTLQEFINIIIVQLVRRSSRIANRRCTRSPDGYHVTDGDVKTPQRA